MTKIDELLKEIEEIREKELADYNKFLHLFSEDNAVKTLAEINEKLGRIAFLAKMSKIKELEHPQDKALRTTDYTGKFVKVKPCGQEYEGKTYLGIMIGEIALGSSVTIENDKISCWWSGYNPAILIPEKKTVVYGAESWWGKIKSEADLKEITDIDIENVWYVKALKSLQKSTVSK